MSAAKSVTVFIRGDAREAIAEIKKMSGEVAAESETMGSKMAAFGKKAALIAGGAALAIGGMSIKLADDFEKSHANLVTAVDNSGHKLGEFTKTIDRQQQSFQKLGYNQSQYQAGLAAMTTATNNPAKSLQLMGLAADLAAKKHIDLETASIAVGKAVAGNLKPIKALGIDLPVAATNAVKLAAAHDKLTAATQKAFYLNNAYHAGLLTGKGALQQVEKANNAVKDAQDKLNTAQSAGDLIIAGLGRRLAGTASAQAETFGGKLKAMKAEAENLGIKIGMALIPILSTLIGWVQKAVDWFEKHRTVAIAVGIAVGVLVTAYTGLMIIAKVNGAIEAATVLFGTMTGGAGAAAIATDGLAASEVAAATASEGLAVAEGTATVGMLGFLGPAALVAAAAYGIYYGLTNTGYQFDVNSKNVNKLANQDMPGLISSMAHFATVTDSTKPLMSTFNDLLAQSPARAKEFADGIYNETQNLSLFNQMIKQIPPVVNTTVVANTGDATLALQRYAGLFAGIQQSANLTFAGAIGGAVNYHPTPHYSPFGVYLGTYGDGGIVPGQVGKPGWAIVHGGEKITTPAQQKAGATAAPIQINLHIDGKQVTSVVVDHLNNGGGPKLNPRVVKSR